MPSQNVLRSSHTCENAASEEFSAFWENGCPQVLASGCGFDIKVGGASQHGLHVSCESADGLVSTRGQRGQERGAMRYRGWALGVVSSKQ